jgi:hypothetical protein
MKCLFLSASLAVVAQTAIAQAPAVGPPPPELAQRLQLDPHYQKCVLVGGFPILGSAKVDDRAFAEAAYLIEHMLAHKPAIREALVKNKVRCAIMAHDEFTTSVPEHRTLRPASYWNRRARGLGASASRPTVSCAEENLLCLRGDPYGTECILIHEFAHAMHEMGLRDADPTFDRRLDIAFRAAMRAGLWKGKYASVNRMEYWAEGVQSWYHTNRENDHDHNHVNTRPEIKEYDPELAKLLAEVLGDEAWIYERPEKRTQAAHFAGFDREKAPAFAWPKELLPWTDRGLADPKVRIDGLPDLPFQRLKAGEKPPSSTRAGAPCSLIIANAGKKECSVAWVDEKGNLVPYGTVRPGFIELQETFAGHVWLVTGEDGTPIGHATASGEQARVLVEE